MIELPGRTGVVQVRLVHGLRDKEPQEIPIPPYLWDCKVAVATQNRIVRVCRCLRFGSFSSRTDSRPTNREASVSGDRGKSEIAGRRIARQLLPKIPLGAEKRAFIGGQTREPFGDIDTSKHRYPPSIASSFLCGLPVTSPCLRPGGRTRPARGVPRREINTRIENITRKFPN